MLRTWCEALAELQINDKDNARIDGGILCPACGRFHGRCVDAIYPFMYMAKLTTDATWVDRAKRLYNWGESTVSLPSGAMKNDIESSWEGITTLYVIMLADTITCFADLLDEATLQKWRGRVKSAAEYLLCATYLNENNVNYSVSSALALEKAYSLFSDYRYRAAGEQNLSLALDCLEQSGLLFGEGVPRKRISKRGCRPVDIGYNVEETLPMLVEYSVMRNDGELMKRLIRSYEWHLQFMFPDGGWDNSFGTRKFKWTYWGSRTTDGCLFGLLAASVHAPMAQAAKLQKAAQLNYSLLDRCTHSGLLEGGVNYFDAGQPACIHHTFEHSKTLVSCITKGFKTMLDEESSAFWAPTFGHLCAVEPELGIMRVESGALRAVICFADWEYRKGIITSGGLPTSLYHYRFGPILLSGMAQYSLIERANMQSPHCVRHECTALRIEGGLQGERLSSTNDKCATVDYDLADESISLTVKGALKEADGDAPGIPYIFEMVFDNCLRITVRVVDGRLVLPIVSASSEEVVARRGEIMITKRGNGPREAGAMSVIVNVGEYELPYGDERIFNLVPGVQALRIDVLPVDGLIDILLRFV